jgi:4-hydroxybenzoate polyprenyltransferase
MKTMPPEDELRQPPFSCDPVSMGTWLKAIRVHQWAKNLLIFVPLLAAHDLSITSKWREALVGFTCFSLGASAIYLINDVVDRNEDSQHPSKRFRAIASGAIKPGIAIFISLILLIAALFIGAFLTRDFEITLIFYLVLTIAYSFYLKRVAIVDVIALTLFYVVRVIAGANATNIQLSFWLLGFSIFIFLSLGFAKRYSELVNAIADGVETGSKRGYQNADAPIILILGVSAGYAALVILALYLNTDLVQGLYAHPRYIWALVPVVTFWVNWIWLCAYRGEMNEDPVLFALQEKSSLFTAIAAAAVLIVSSVH